jgi:aromatic-L-amino-acid decarboxylase
MDALRRAVREDRRAGMQPFLVVGNAGTTNTGAVDPLDELADVAEEEGLWVHVDGAYGGLFQLTERGRAFFRGIERSDSIAVDPHKDIPNFTDYSPELSRDFRGLRVWLPVQLHGLAAFRSALDEKLDLARLLYEGLRDTPGFELPWEPELTVVAFRYRPRAGDEEAFNRALLERINASKRVFLSSTLIDGRFVIRACIVSHRTHRDRIEETLEIIRRSALELDAGR